MFWKKKNKKDFLKSIRVRLILGYTFVLFAGIIAVSIYFSFQTRARLGQITKQYLSSELKIAVELLGNEADNEIGMSDFLSKHTRGIKGSHKVGYALFDGKGFILARSEGFSEDKKPVENIINLGNKQKTPAPFDSESQTEFSISESTFHNSDKTTAYIATLPFRDRAGKIFYLQFGVTPFGHQEAVKVFFKTGLLMIPLVILIGLISGLILTGQFLSPISRLIKASDEIVRSDVTQELPVRGTGDELDKLAQAFNNVLKELRESYQKIIVFTADASHEIRLPITAIKGEAEVILERGGDIKEYRDIMESIIIEMDRLTVMVNRSEERRVGKECRSRWSPYH